MSLRIARRRRSQRAAALATLAESRGSLAEAVREPPSALKRAPLWVVLLAWPGMGPAKARRACERAQVWPLTPLGELTARELERLDEVLP